MAGHQISCEPVSTRDVIMCGYDFLISLDREYARCKKDARMFYYAHTHRVRMLDFLPKEIKICEIGVYEGQFSSQLLERAAPSALHLVDPWIQHDDPDYLRDTANSDSAIQNARYSGVLNKFENYIEKGLVLVHRMTGEEASKRLPDNYFDFIYIDAMHYEGAVYADLKCFLPKIKNHGIIAGHDYANHPLSQRKNFGVINGVDRFLNENEEFSLLAISSERWPSYFIGRRDSAMASKFLSALHESDVPCVCLPQALRSQCRQMVVPRERGPEKVVGRFVR
jgi:hypothetical protein